MSLPDGAPASTRGDLLTRAEAGITASERSLFSARRVLPVLGWSIGLMVMIFGQANDGPDDSGELVLFTGLGVAWWIIARLVPGKAFIGHLVAAGVVLVAGVVLLPIAEDLDGTAARTAFLVLWAVVAAGFAWALWTYVTTGRGLIATIDAWRSARRDPALRELDNSDVTPGIATVHDLRDRADFDDVVQEVRGRHQARMYDLSTAKPIFILMITGILGLVFTITSFLHTDASLWAVAAFSGLLVLAPWLWTWVDLMQTLLGRQTEANQVEVEAQLYGIRRHHTSGAEVEPHHRFSLLNTPGGKILLVAWIALLVFRFSTSDGLAIIVALGVVLLLATIVVFRMWTIGRQIKVFPLAGAGDSVLQSPARRAALTLTSDSLTIADAAGRARPHVIPTSDIVAIAPLKGMSLTNQRGVGIVTNDAPVVLAGHSVSNDPAVTELRSRLASAD